MNKLSNLPLAVRLGLGFGALALALVIVGALGASRISTLGGAVQQLSDNDVKAVQGTGGMTTRLADAGAAFQATVQALAADAARTASADAASAKRTVIVVVLFALLAAAALALWLTRSVVRPVGAIAAGLTSLDEHVAGIAEASSASAEQVSAATQQTSASTQEIAQSAVQLARAAEELDALVGRFRLAA